MWAFVSSLLLLRPEEGEGRLGAPLLIYLSGVAVALQSHCFATILLHHAPVDITSVLLLIVTFRGSIY